jgi:hypothetical protein
MLSQRKNFSPWQTRHRANTFFPQARAPCRVALESPLKATVMEATMELSMRLNVLAALLSFGFIAAIVFGIV